MVFPDITSSPLSYRVHEANESASGILSFRPHCALSRLIKKRLLSYSALSSLLDVSSQCSLSFISIVNLCLAVVFFFLSCSCSPSTSSSFILSFVYLSSHKHKTHAHTQTHKKLTNNTQTKDTHTHFPTHTDISNYLLFIQSAAPLSLCPFLLTPSVPSSLLVPPSSRFPQILARIEQPERTPDKYEIRVMRAN